jgi:hypothetical protein
MPSASATDRITIARLAAHALHARVADPTAHTAPGRAAFLSRFDREVDPDGILAPDVRARRAEHAKRAYFSQLARKSAKARNSRLAQADRVTALIGVDPSTMTDADLIAAIAKLSDPSKMSDAQISRRVEIVATAMAVLDSAQSA